MPEKNCATTGAKNSWFIFPHYDKDAIGSRVRDFPRRFQIDPAAYETGALRLFNIAKDPGERRDLATENAGKSQRAGSTADGILAAVSAQMPTPNMNYDASRPTQTKQGGKRKEKP